NLALAWQPFADANAARRHPACFQYVVASGAAQARVADAVMQGGGEFRVRGLHKADDLGRQAAGPRSSLKNVEPGRPVHQSPHFVESSADAGPKDRMDVRAGLKVQRRVAGLVVAETGVIEDEVHEIGERYGPRRPDSLEDDVLQGLVV